MVEPDSVRIEIAFDGGQIMGAFVTVQGADELERSLAAEGAELVDEEPREGLFGLQVAFVHPDAVHGVLTEVVSVG